MQVADEVYMHVNKADYVDDDVNDAVNVAACSYDISSVYQWPELNESDRIKAKARLETFTSRVLNCRYFIRGHKSPDF